MLLSQILQTKNFNWPLTVKDFKNIEDQEKKHENILNLSLVSGYIFFIYSFEFKQKEF